MKRRGRLSYLQKMNKTIQIIRNDTIVFLSELKNLPQRLKQNYFVKNGYSYNKVIDLGVLYTYQLVDELVNLQPQYFSQLPRQIKAMLKKEKKINNLNQTERYQMMVEEIAQVEYFQRFHYLERKSFNILDYRFLCSLLLKIKPHRYKLESILYLDQHLTWFQRKMLTYKNQKYEQILYQQRKDYLQNEVIFQQMLPITSSKQTKKYKKRNNFTSQQRQESEQQESFFNSNKIPSKTFNQNQKQCVLQQEQSYSNQISNPNTQQSYEYPIQNNLQADLERTDKENELKIEEQRANYRYNYDYTVGSLQKGGNSQHQAYVYAQPQHKPQSSQIPQLQKQLQLNPSHYQLSYLPKISPKPQINSKPNLQPKFKLPSQNPKQKPKQKQLGKNSLLQQPLKYPQHKPKKQTQNPQIKQFQLGNNSIFLNKSRVDFNYFQQYNSNSSDSNSVSSSESKHSQDNGMEFLKKERMKVFKLKTLENEIKSVKINLNSNIPTKNSDQSHKIGGIPRKMYKKRNYKHFRSDM